MVRKALTTLFHIKNKSLAHTEEISSYGALY